MKIRDSVAFVTGANRGLGLAFAQELLAAGARKVYAAARNPGQISLNGVVQVPLDVTAPNSIAAAAKEYPDVNLLINNAGICYWSGFLSAGAGEERRRRHRQSSFHLELGSSSGWRNLQRIEGRCLGFDQLAADGFA